MNRRIKQALCFLACTPLLCTAAEAAEIEQIQAVVPDIKVYLQDTEGGLAGLQTQDITAALDGTPLQVEEFAAVEEQGVNYFFLMDISGSIPAGQFDAAKQAVLDLQNTLGEDDTLSVITFGSQVSLLLDGTQTPSQAAEILAPITAQDANTHFYDAMGMLVETVLAAGGERNIAVVVSDGVDAADDNTGMTRADLEDLLRRSGVAVYALAVDTGQDLTEFQDFITLTGGELYPFSADSMTQALADLRGRVGSAWMLELYAPGTQADGQVHELTLTLGETEPLAVPLTLDRWQPDTTAPTLENLQASPSGTVTLTFSEAMADPTRTELYELTDADGASYPIDEITVSEDGRQVVLHFAAVSSVGGWTLRLQGMTDASMEKNPLPDAQFTLGAADSSAAVSDDLPPEVLGAALLLGVVILAAIALVVGLTVYSRRSRRKPAPQNTPEKEPAPVPPKQKVTFFFNE